jgi:hypothetical protein
MLLDYLNKNYSQIIEYQETTLNFKSNIMTKELINYYIWYLELLLVQSDKDKYNFYKNYLGTRNTGLCFLLKKDMDYSFNEDLYDDSLYCYLKSNAANPKRISDYLYWWSTNQKGNKYRNLTIKKTLNYLYEQFDKQ